MYVAFQERGYIAALQIKKFQNPLFDVIKIDFNQHARFSRFLSKIFVKNYRWPNYPCNLFLQRFEDQAKAKLCYWVKYSISTQIFQKRDLAAGILLKYRLWETSGAISAKLPDFHLFSTKILICLCPDLVSKKSRYKLNIPLNNKVLN